MRDFFLNLRDKFSSPMPASMQDAEMEEEVQTGYVELGVTSESEPENQKVTVRPYVMEEFEDIKAILDSLREGKTVALINIKPLKEKDIIELKRAVNKLRKTCEAIDGDIAGFGEDYIVAVPYFAKIHRTSSILQE